MAKKKAAKKKTAKKKATKKKAAAKEMLLVGSKTKLALKSMDVNVAGDALEALNEVVYWYIHQAATRATANGRKTVRGHDFLSM
jgi:histone H3/H4